MKHTLLIEFGQINSDSRLDKTQTLFQFESSGYGIEMLLSEFSEQQFREEAGPYGKTFGIVSLINSVTKNELEKFLKSGKVGHFAQTDHDMHRDYFVRITHKIFTREDILRGMELQRTVCGVITTSWWKFGKAAHGRDHLIIHNDEYWYRMFGNFYWNTGKRK